MSNKKLCAQMLFFLCCIFLSGCGFDTKSKDSNLTTTIRSGESIYVENCKSWHGDDGKRQALSRSGVIAGSSSVELQLQAYRAGTLNKFGMGSVMKGNVSRLSDAEIKAVSDYVAGLK